MNDPSYPGKMTPAEEAEFDAKNEKQFHELKRRRNIAEAYVREYEHGNTTLTDLSKRYEVDRKTLYNWVNYDREFYELLIEARIKIGNAVGDLKHTNLRRQIERLEQRLEIDTKQHCPHCKAELPAEFQNNGLTLKQELDLLDRIAKLSNLYSEKTYEQTQRERPQGIKKRLRDQMIAMLENICSFDPEEFEEKAPPRPRRLTKSR